MPNVSQLTTPDAPQAGPPIGERVRGLRTAHALSLRELGRRVSLSPSFLSEVERGMVEPSISALKRIATALDVRLEYFFSEYVPDASTGAVVLHRGSGRRLHAMSGVEFERLTPDSADVFEVIYGTYQPGASTGDEEIFHDGTEWGMVTSGRFKVWVGAQVLFLEPGDCIAFKSTIPHRVQNISGQVGEYVWVNSPPSL